MTADNTFGLGVKCDSEGFILEAARCILSWQPPLFAPFHECSNMTLDLTQSLIEIRAVVAPIDELGRHVKRKTGFKVPELLLKKVRKSLFVLCRVPLYLKKRRLVVYRGDYIASSIRTRRPRRYLLQS